MTGKGNESLRANLDELCSAMEDGSYEHEYYLNLETGEILFISDYMDDEETGRLRNSMDEKPECYERIAKAESNEGYEDMVDFVAAVEDEQFAELLEVAINGRGAFRRFKDVLARHPEERARSFQFKDERMEERALEWLDDIGISLVRD